MPSSTIVDTIKIPFPMDCQKLKYFYRSIYSFILKFIQMATFSSFFTASGYGYAKVLDNLNGGWNINVGKGIATYDAYPKNGVLLHTVSPAQTFNTSQGNTITINSIIEILPQGLNQQSIKIATDATFAQLATNGA